MSNALCRKAMVFFLTIILPFISLACGGKDKDVPVTEKQEFTTATNTNGQKEGQSGNEEKKHWEPDPSTDTSNELPVKAIPGFYSAAEAYFSPDGNSLVCNAKIDDKEDAYHVYTATIDGKVVKRINNKGDDACSFITPDNKHILFTSTRDNLDMPKGNYSDPFDYPQGAELYICNIDGSDVKRLTNNKFYDAEVSMSPDGKWILFARQVNGQIDLYKMNADGSGEVQITNTPDWQEGGAFFMSDSETIIYRAWKTVDQKLSPKPMALFTIKQDGTDGKERTKYEVTNWAPFPSSDSKHVVFTKVVSNPNSPRPNFEIYLLNLQSEKLTRLTYSDAFDGFPALAPDGKTLMFTSSRSAPKGVRGMNLFLMDISTLIKE